MNACTNSRTNELFRWYCDFSIFGRPRRQTTHKIKAYKKKCFYRHLNLAQRLHHEIVQFVGNFFTFHLKRVWFGACTATLCTHIRTRGRTTYKLYSEENKISNTRATTRYILFIHFSFVGRERTNVESVRCVMPV